MKGLVMAQAQTQEAIAEVAQILGLEVPEPCYEGIVQNLALLRNHIAVLESCPAEDGSAA